MLFVGIGSQVVESFDFEFWIEDEFPAVLSKGALGVHVGAVNGRVFFGVLTIGKKGKQGTEFYALALGVAS